MTELPAPHPESFPPPGQRRPGAVGWFFLRPDQLPARWRPRAQDVVLVPLLPHEAAEVLDGIEAGIRLSPDEETLVHLIAEGASVSTIGVELGLHPRTVSRRIARLRDRLGVVTTAELVALLSQTGFAFEDGGRES